MTDTANRPDWLHRLIGLIEGSITTETGPFDTITGAQWRDFYCNHWPREFYIDDFRVDFENERGDYILPDDAQHPFEAFGMAVWHDNSSFGPLKNRTMVDVYMLYSAIMGNAGEETVSFKIDPEKRAALVAAAEEIGARVI